MDTTEISHGNKIINFCKTFDFIILNGRTEGDPFGNYTHLNFNNGPSTIDYALCNKKCYELISNFLILPMNELSDHSKIVSIFKESLSIKKEDMKMIITNGSKGVRCINGIKREKIFLSMHCETAKEKLRKLSSA